MAITITAFRHKIDEGLCGRTTVSPNRRGVDALTFLLESHAPIEYVLLMLGTNDCKTKFNSSENAIAEEEGCLFLAA